MDDTDAPLDQDKINDFSRKIKDLESDLAKIQGVMDKIESGTFGKCEECGKELDLHVIAKNPVQQLCSDHDHRTNVIL